jgi:AcrR family transcriptional regulator
MEQNSGPVKKPRRYDSTRRQEQARQTREAILDVARRRFLRDGFAGTTIAAIAGDAGVSVDTVYKTFGGKAGLVQAICENGLAGQGEVHAEARSDALQTTEPDPLKVMRGIGELAAEVAPRVAPIMLLIRDAAVTDTEMAALKAEFDDQRLERMTHNARNLADAGHLRPGLSTDDAGEIMWTYSSPELYELLIIKRGWSEERYGAFTAAALAAALLPPDIPRQQTTKRRK